MSVRVAPRPAAGDPDRPPPPSPGCGRCPGSPALELHQPDELASTLLLGICPECRRWYLRREYADGHSLLTELDLSQGGGGPPSVPITARRR